MDLTAVVALVLGIPTVLLAIWALFRQGQRTTVADTYKELYEAQHARADDAEAAAGKERRECTEQMASLTARIEVLEGRWLDQLGQRLGKQVGDAIRVELERRTA